MIKELQPKEVFSIFHEITQVPRPSKREGKIIEWLKAFAVKHNLEHTVDEAGNIIMRKPATPGYEDKPGVILQAHMDMVCEKNNDTVHDFDNDLSTPILMATLSKPRVLPSVRIMVLVWRSCWRLSLPTP